MTRYADWEFEEEEEEEEEYLHSVPWSQADYEFEEAENALVESFVSAIFCLASRAVPAAMFRSAAATGAAAAAGALSRRAAQVRAAGAGAGAALCRAAQVRTAQVRAAQVHAAAAGALFRAIPSNCNAKNRSTSNTTGSQNLVQRVNMEELAHAFAMRYAFGAPNASADVQELMDLYKYAHDDALGIVFGVLEPTSGMCVDSEVKYKVKSEVKSEKDKVKSNVKNNVHEKKTRALFLEGLCSDDVLTKALARTRAELPLIHCVHMAVREEDGQGNRIERYADGSYVAGANASQETQTKWYREGYGKVWSVTPSGAYEMLRRLVDDRWYKHKHELGIGGQGRNAEDTRSFAQQNFKGCGGEVTDTAVFLANAHLLDANAWDAVQDLARPLSTCNNLGRERPDVRVVVIAAGEDVAAGVMHCG